MLSFESRAALPLLRDNSRWVMTPIVANGLMYVSEGSGRVVAFDAVTGELVWTYLRTYPQDIAMSEAYPRHRGVSIYGDAIYFGTADSFLVALDARTGAKLWEVQTGDYRTGEGHAAVDVLHGAAQRRARLRDVDGERPMAAARCRGLEHGELRRGARARLLLDWPIDAVDDSLARSRRFALFGDVARA